VADATEVDRPLDVTLADRRKIGDHLIVPLRGKPFITDPAKVEVDAHPKALWGDALAPTRALVVALPIGAAMWAVASFAIWHFL
jgi:hypothetical protein